MKGPFANSGRLQGPLMGAVELGRRAGDRHDAGQGPLERGEGSRRGLVCGERDHVGGANERLVEREQDGQLHDGWQAPTELVDAVLAIQRHCLLGDLRPIALVLSLDLANQRLHPLHLLLRADLLGEERRENRRTRTVKTMIAKAKSLNRML